MKKIVIFIFFVSLLFAVKQVPRPSNRNTEDESPRTVEPIQRREVVQERIDDRDNKQKDYFQDSDSNSINDRREDDFQEIKGLKTKFKDFLKKKPEEKKERVKTVPRQETSRDKKEKQR
jgi:hypothetical protein